MRPKHLLFSLCCLSLAVPSVLRAQFPAPTQEELEMTSDPQSARGRRGLSLSRRDDRRQSALSQGLFPHQSAHRKGQGTRDRSRSLRASQFQGHRYPGTHHSLRWNDHSADRQTLDLMDVKTKDFQVNTMVFTLPSVEVGSILEYKLQIRYDDNTVSSPDWDVQQPYFVHKAHYSFFLRRTTGFITNSRGDVSNQLNVWISWR